MKRSEMIKALEETFSKFESPSSIAERALSAMESKGMLPPNNSSWSCSGCSQCTAGDCDKDHTDDCYWEHE